MSTNEGRVKRLAAQHDMKVLKVRGGGYWLLDVSSNTVVLGSRAGWARTTVSLAEIENYLNGR